MKKSNVTINYIYNLAYQIITLIIPLCLTPYLTRILGSENLGIFSYTSSYVILFISLASLGLNIYGQREIAYRQDDIYERSKIFWELVVIRFFSTLIMVLFYIAFFGISAEYKIYYLYFLPYLVSNMFDITWLFQGMEKFKNVSIYTLIIRFLYVIISFFLIKNISDLKIYIIIFSFSYFIQYLIFWFDIKRYIIGIHLKDLCIKKHMKNVILFFIPQISTTIYTIMDRTMIGVLINKIDNVYYYEQSSYIIKTLVVFITTFGTVMLSKSSSFFSQNRFNEIKENLRSIINFVWLFGCALLFGICGIIETVVPWFYGGNYYMIQILVYSLSSLIIIIGLNNIIGLQILVPIKRNDKYTLSIVIGTIVNFLLNYILIRKIGVIGAAISSVIGETVVLFVELSFVKDIVRFRDLIYCAPRYILYGLIMFLSIKYIGTILNLGIFTTIIQIVFGVFIYVGLLLLFKDEFVNKYILVFFRRKNEKNNNN